MSAKLLDGGAILVGGNTTLEEGRGVLANTGGSSLLGSVVALKTGADVGVSAELLGGGGD